jgi:hypothetical protein
MIPRCLPITFLAIVLSGASGRGLAQNITPAASDPSPEEAPTFPASQDPREEAVPGLQGGDLRIPPAAALAEGAFVPPRHATLVRGVRGGWYAVFHPDASGTVIPPMGLLPCAMLERVETLATQQGDRSRLRLSGQVCLYRGRNYLLVASATPVVEPTALGTERQPDAAEGPPRPSGADAADPTVEQLIRELEADRETPRALDADLASADPGPEGQPAEHAPSSVIPEGQAVVRRRARIIRLGGAWAAVFENDAGTDRSDPPLLLLPCLNTERLELRAAARGDALVFELSGRVTTFRGRNWLFPTMFQALRPGEVSSMQ